MNRKRKDPEYRKAYKALLRTIREKFGISSDAEAEDAAVSIVAGSITGHPGIPYRLFDQVTLMEMYKSAHSAGVADAVSEATGKRHVSYWDADYEIWRVVPENDLPQEIRESGHVQEHERLRNLVFAGTGNGPSQAVH